MLGVGFTRGDKIDQEGTMTAIAYRTTHTQFVSRDGTFLMRLSAWCGKFIEGAREGQRIAARYHELSQLSGPDLARRGLTRETMARAALTGN